MYEETDIMRKALCLFTFLHSVPKIVAFTGFNKDTITVKLEYKSHPWDPKIVAVVDGWLLFRGNLCYKRVRLEKSRLTYLRLVYFVDNPTANQTPTLLTIY